MIFYWWQVILLCFLCHYLGQLAGERRGKKKERQKVRPVLPICPCSHSIGEHLEMGRCQSAVRRPHYDSIGNKNGREWVECACTKYYGPVPAIDFFHPGFATTNGPEDD
jgi:hypothetical protein